MEELYRIYSDHPSISTDTRQIKKGDIFFALNGPTFKGSDFIEEAFDKGASWCVTETVFEGNDRICKVPDTLIALQQLALFHRKNFNIPFIAITGSNGKTTTKELIHVVLSTKYKTYTTEGNLNNHIGIPLTILRIRQDAEIAVIEMGANHIGEIKSYCQYTLPTHGLITNCGKAHLEGFGSIEGVRKGKGELFEYLAANKGTAFVFNDEQYLVEMAGKIGKMVTYGTSNSDYSGNPIDEEGLLSVKTHDAIFKTNLVGSYNLPNVLASVAVGKYFGVETNKIINALKNYKPSNSRSQLIRSGTNNIILDAYNANPSSMELAIKNISSMPGKKILLIGGMKELGIDSHQEHRKIVDLIDSFSWDYVALVGREFSNLSGKYEHFNNSEEAGEWLKNINPMHSSILIKGSRGTRMENVLNYIG